MIELKQTETFRKWWTRLKDKRALGVILARLDRLAYGHAGMPNRSGTGSANCASTMALATGSISRGVGTR
jgi:putative component of toxin-antitoxin plasmid stabilization module